MRDSASALSHADLALALPELYVEWPEQTVIRDAIFEAQAAEPAICQVQVHFLAEAPL